MIHIRLDLGNVPSVLHALADPDLARRVAMAAAESYVDDIHDTIDAGTAFTPRSGQLQQSINWRPVGMGAEVYANAEYAPYVEQGTGVHVGHNKWVIRPKDGRKGLKIPVSGGGGYIIRRSVTHYGSKPHPFFFADRDTRLQGMQARGLSVLARYMEQALG